MTTQKKHFRQFKFSENSLDGEVVLEGARIRVLFRFSPERVAFIKSITGARYDGQTKTWSFPRERFETFKASGLFPEDRYPRRFSEASLAHSLEELGDLKTKALEAYKSDPFSVDAQYLPFLPLEVVFSLAADAPQVRARVRFGSKAAPLLVRLKGSHFLRSEGLFAVPAETLTPLIVKLREKKFTFAVEADCGVRLKKSAELRKKLLLEPEHASPQELEEAFLTPYVDFAEQDADSSETLFALRHATSRHLAALFPDDETFHVRKKKSLALTERELLTLLNRTQGLKYPLYLARAVRSHLDRRGLHFDEAIASGNLALSEELLPFLKTPCAWVVLSATRAGLILDEALVLGGALCSSEKLKAFTFEQVSGKRFYSAPDIELIQLYQALKPHIAAKETEAFSKLITDLTERSADLKANAEARKSLDTALDPALFSDPALVEKLFPHQRVAVKWLAAREYSMLGDDMGLGKTLSVLATADLLLHSGEISLALIICPNSLTRNWLREVEHFLPGRKLMQLPDAKADRGRILKALTTGKIKCDGLVVNYERMRRPDVHAALLRLTSNCATLLCADESQRLKNARSQTYLALREIARNCGRRIALTGTPTPRDITDIWSQVELLDFGKRFGTHYTKWLKTVADLGTKYSDYAVRKFKTGSVDETISRVHELLLRRKKEEVVSLPEKTFVVRDCKLTGTQAIRYREICEQLLLRIGTLNGGSFIKQIDNLLEEYLRAVQIASNPRLVDENWKGEPAKFSELDEIVDEVVRERGQKIVIWTNFLINVDELVTRYQDLGARPFSGKVSTAERDKTIQEFQNGSDVRILVAIPAAGGVGITLTAAQTAVYLDKSWNAEYWLQSVDRIHRIGQRGSVTIISLSACKIDELIGRNLLRKGRAQAALLGDTQHVGDTQRTTETLDYPSREELINALTPDTTEEETSES